MTNDAIQPSTILIVTGAHLAAEIAQRPLAYFLRGRILEALGPDTHEDRVIVCSDVWYLNHAELRRLAAVSLGPPHHNALSAYLASRVPSVIAVDGVYVVQMDIDADPPLVCCWGDDPDATASAVHVFAERFLETFLGAATA